MTSHQEYADRLITLVNQVLGTETSLVGDSDLVDDVGLSSVQIMELIENVEDEFEIEIPDDDTGELLDATVIGLARKVEALVDG